MNFDVHYCSEERKESILRALAVCLERYAEISFAYAHGSFIAQGPFRDLDIALYLYAEKVRDAGFRFEDRVAQDVGKTLNAPFPLDVRVMNEAPPAFQYHAIRGRLILERCSAHRIEVVCRIIQRYLDLKPILDHHVREAFIDAVES